MEFVQPIRETTTIERMKNTLRRSGTRNYMLFVAGINSGLRISDLLTLKVGDVRSKTHISLREAKTGKERRFKISPTLRRELDEYMDGMTDGNWLFPSRQGTKPITRVQAYRILNDAAKTIGIEEIGTHTLRKTFGYHMYQQTKDVAMLQQIFGHSAPSITLRYIGINHDMIDEAYDNFGL
jgi:integrase